MRLIKNYMNNDTLRHELNTLTEATFGFNFEGWVTNGYFEGDYIPYSLEENGKILSNVSANIMKFQQNGKIRNYIQLGTVMTDENYRKQGLARKLMEYVINEYEDKCDGIYLFGDLDALDFYRKMGFEEKGQYRYSLKQDVIKNDNVGSFVKVSADDEELRNKYLEYVRESVAYGAFEQINKYGLQMFYTAGFYNVYYSKDLDCFVVLDVEDGVLEIQSVICKKYILLEQIISSINIDYEKLRLGFTPRNEDLHLFECEEYDGGDDYRLFCRGERLNSIGEEKLYFPTLSHA